MKIAISTPASPGSTSGNRVTAERWRKILQDLGHRVEVMLPDDSPEVDLLVAIHARKSHRAVRAFHDHHPGGQIVVALSGTDLTEDLHATGDRRESVLDSLSLADRIVVLHPLAPPEVPKLHRARVRVILQSARSLEHPPPRTRRILDMVVVGHLRSVKDPFVPAEAARLLPARSRIRIAHFGAALDQGTLQRARSAMARDARYRWHGEKPRGVVRQWIARSHALVHPSRAEGGANTVGEALVLGTPVLASAIPGNFGLLGPDYPGVFPVGDAPALAALLSRFESEPTFRARLSERCQTLARQHRPEREVEAWEKLLGEF